MNSAAQWQAAITGTVPDIEVNQADDRARRVEAYNKTVKLVSSCVSDMVARSDLEMLGQFTMAVVDLFKQASDVVNGGGKNGQRPA